MRRPRLSARLRSRRRCPDGRLAGRSGGRGTRRIGRARGRGCVEWEAVGRLGECKEEREHLR
jgi:hypothetical protein